MVNVAPDVRATMGDIFNLGTGNGFVRSLGGRSSFDFSPKTLTCTTRFYDYLRRAATRLGFEGRKFPFALSTQNVQVNLRFRLYQDVLAVEIERSPIAMACDDDSAIDQTSLWAQGAIAELVQNILGLIANPASSFQALTQRPKVFTCNRVIGDDSDRPSEESLVRLLTRHKTATDMVVTAVLKKNQGLQSDSSMLLVDRQGVVAAIPKSLIADQTTIRRYFAAAHMHELVACVERMVERKSLLAMPKNELDELSSWFLTPQKRFTFSTSSLHIWQCLVQEFGLTPQAWVEIEKEKMLQQHALPKPRVILIITAIEAEAGPSLNRLNEVLPKEMAGVFVNKGTFSTAAGIVEVIVCSVGVGNTKAVLNTTRLIDALTPDLTVFCGIAGGRKEATIGSVVLASVVYNYESGKESPKGFAPRPRTVSLSNTSEFLATAFLAHERSTKKPYDVFFKPIACGEKVVGTTKGASGAVIDSTYGDALAVEMEGFGFLSALAHNDVPALLVRGISDRLDKKEATENHGLAIDNATDLVFRLIDYFAIAKQSSSSK